MMFSALVWSFMLNRFRFSKKSFFSWAERKGLIQKDSQGKNTKLKKIDGKPYRCVFLKLDEPIDIDPDGTKHMGDGTKIDHNGFIHLEDEQMELPFT